MKVLVTPLAGALAAALALVAGTARADDELKTLTPDQVEQMLGRADVKVFDANPPDEYEKHHLPGATLVAKGSLAAALPADRGTTLVFYCAGPK